MMAKPPATWIATTLAIACANVLAIDDINPSYHRKSVHSVTIDTNQHVFEGSSAPEGEDCTKFKMSSQDVKQFLNRAIGVRSLHDYTFSKCSADGQVTFTDGQRGTWLIMSSRLAYLHLSDGRSYDLYCRDADCRQKVFAGWRGSKSDSDEAADDMRHEARREREWRMAKASGRSGVPFRTIDLDKSYRHQSIQTLIVVKDRIFSPSAASIGDEPCGDFKVSEADARHFLQRASAVAHGEDFPLGGCTAEGTVIFANGRKASWTLTSSRAGHLFFEEEGKYHDLYCPNSICVEAIYSRYRKINSILDVPGHEPSEPTPPR